KSGMPSVVSGVSLPVSTSRTHRFQSFIYAVRRPSGEGTSVRVAPRPPRPLRPPLAGGAHSGSVHGVFVPFAASTSTASLPASVVMRYQNRSPLDVARGDPLDGPSASQLARTPERYTSGATLPGSIFSARA